MIRLGLFTVVLSLFMAAQPPALQAETTQSHAFNFLGTPKYPADFEHFDYVNPDAPKGGQFSTWTSVSFDNFNPFARQGRGPTGWGDLVDRLMVPSGDEIGSLYGLIAESLEYPEDHSWVIFTLRPEARFTDGTPLTAEDVVFTHSVLREQALPSYALAVRETIADVEALGPHQVRFTFTPQSAKRERIGLAANQIVLSKEWFERTGQRLDEPSPEPMLVSSPYVIGDYSFSSHISYVRDPDYWGADVPVNVGSNNFDEIRYEIFSDSNAAFEGFKAGEYTFRVENSSVVWATQYDFPALDKGTVVRETIDLETVPAIVGWGLNLRRDKFQDLRVREAIGLAFNPQWTRDVLQYGLFDRLNSYFENADVEAKGVPEGAELALLQELGDLVDPALLTEPVVDLHEGGPRQANRRDLGRASRLLDEAGWTVGEDGLRRNAKGETLDVAFLSANPGFDRVTLPFVENLQAIGVNATYNRIDQAQYVSRRDSRDFDVIYVAWLGSPRPGGNFEQYFGSVGDEDFNYIGLSDPAIDEVTRRLAGADTEEEVMTLSRVLDRLLRHQRGVVLSWYKANSWVSYYDFYRKPDNLPPFSTGVPSIWWFDQAAYERLKAEGALN